jgi:hypothetical protein
MQANAARAANKWLVQAGPKKAGNTMDRQVQANTNLISGLGMSK